jgi:hypothetical protein
MTAPLDATNSDIVEVAQAQPRTGGAASQTGQQIVARIPPDCVRTDVQVQVDVANRYMLPQVPNVGALRKMVQGENLVVSTQGLGALVLDDFVTAARSGNPPFVVLADGTVLTAQQVLRLPERQIAVDQCQPQSQATDQTAADLAQTAPGAGPPGAAGAPGATGAQQLAQIAPAAGPGGGGGAGGGEAGGARFQSNFAPSPFDDLNYNPVQPLAFDRSAPELAPGSNLLNDQPPVIPDTPEPPGPNDTVVTIGPASGAEDFATAADQSAAQAAAGSVPSGPIALPINVTSADSSETITVAITLGPGVDPASVQINGQPPGPNGWVFPQSAVVQGLAITQLPTDSDRDIPLNVTVTTVQTNPDGSQSTFVSGPTPLTVVVDAIADDPIVTLTGGPATGVEDTPIALPDISTTLQDTDGTETVERRVISDLPPGTLILLNGNPLPLTNGQVDVTNLTPAELNNLQVQPPPDFAGSFTLNLLTTVFDAPQDGEITLNNNRVTVSTPIPVTVTPVPDTVFNPAPGLGREDGGNAPDQSQNAAPPPGAPANGAIALDFGIALAPNETLRDVVVAGVPAGAVLLVGGVPLPAAASHTLTPAQIALGVSVLPPPDTDANFPLTITPTVSQAGQDFTLPSDQLLVIVDAVADDPLFTLAGADAAGNAAVTTPEDTPAALPDAATLGLQDSGETLSLTIDISGAPAGTTLTAPAGATLTAVPGQPGVFQLSGATPAELQTNFNGLTLNPPANFSGTIPVVVRVTSTENPAEAGDIAADNTATVTHNITVTVTPVADTTFNPAPAAGREDNGTPADQTINGAAPPGSPPNGPIPLDFGITLGPNETLRDVVVGGVPPGAALQSGGAPLTANPDGTYTLTPAQIAAGITLTPPTDTDQNFPLTITPTITQNGTDITLPSAPLQVAIDAVADDPLFTLTGADPAGNAAVTTPEDTAAALPDAATLGLQDTGETLSLTIDISGAPAGTTIVPPPGVTLTPVPGQPGVFQLSGATPAELQTNFNALQIQPPANFSGTIPVVVNVTSTENPAEAGDNPADNTATVTHNITVTVTPVIDTQPSPVVGRGKEDLGTTADQTSAPGNGVADGAIAIPITFANQPANETVDSITVSGVPTGVTLGVRNPDNSITPLTLVGGSVTITAAQGAALVVSGLPVDSDADFQLSVSAVVSQNGVPFATPLTTTVSVLVDAVADRPTLAGPASVSGAEDTVIALTGVSGGFNDSDGSETQTIQVEFIGAPAGTQLLVNGQARAPGPDGKFTITVAELSQLSIQTAANDASDFTTRITATATENATVDPNAAPDLNPAAPETGERVGADNTALQSIDIQVVVNPTADTTFNPLPAAGREDGGNAADQSQNAAPPPGAPANGPIPLNFGIALGPGETLTSVVVAGVPSGGVLQVGGAPLPVAPGGSYTLTAAQVAQGVSLVPPTDGDTNITLTITPTVTQDGQALTLPPAALPVTVDAVADDPLFTLAGADPQGNAAVTTPEDTAAALPDAATLGLQDSGETLSLIIDISGAPAGTTLTAPAGATLTAVPGQPGVFQLSGATPAALQTNFNGLTLNPPANFNGTIPVVVRVTSTENPAEPGDIAADNTATVTHNITVTVAPAPDTQLPPVVARGKEDLGQAADQVPAVDANGVTSGPISIPVAFTNQPANEAVDSVTVSGVPAGVTLGVRNPDNSISPLTVTGGSVTLTAAQAAGLVITGLPADSDRDFQLNVSAVISQNGVPFAAPLTSTISVLVDAVADLPTLNAPAAVTGNEDTAIALTGLSGGFADADGSETQTFTVVFVGAPAGTQLLANGVPLVAGPGGVFTVTSAQLSQLSVQSAPNDATDFTVRVTATATENATVDPAAAPDLNPAAPETGERVGADNTATVTRDVAVDVTPVRDSTLTVAPTSIKEDLGTAPNQTPVPQPPSGAQPVNITLTLGPNETAGTITVSGVPTGVTFNQGTNNNNGTWSFTQAQLTGLTINGLPQNSDAEFTLTVSAAVSQNGVALPPLTGSILVTVDAVADAPVLTLTGTATGAEDTPIALPDIASNLRDTDGSETLSLKLTGVPAGATPGINGVALDAARNLGNGEWNLTGLSQADLNALTLTPPANFSGTISMSVVATATEGATGAGEIQTADNVATTTQNFTVNVTPVRDSTLTVAPTSIKEDLGTAPNQTPVPQPPSGAQPVNITLTLGPNETAGTITVSGVPTGVTFNQGTNNNNGTWSFTQAQLTGLTINGLPQNSDAEFTLTVSAAVSQNGVALPALTGNVVVTVDAVADAPVLTLISNTATGNENTAIALPDITSGLRDTDGSETFSLRLSGVPAGATPGINGVALDPARNLGGGVWDLTGLTQTQLNGLTITPANEFGGSFQLTVTATATEGATGAGEIQTADNVATTSQVITINVNALPNGGQANATVSEAGNEATPNFNAGSNAASNSEVATGSLNYSFDSDGQAAANPFTWGATVTPTDPETGGALTLTSGGVGVVWAVSADGLTITGTKGAGGPVVAILQVTDVVTGAFRYEQIGPFDHPDVGQNGAQDPINLAFNYTIRDGNGDSATGSLNVAVQDDAPVVVPITKSANEQFGANTNLLITLDVSGSMNDPSGVTGLTRLQAAKLAIAELIEQYDQLGDVVVRFVLFSTDASSNAGGWLTADQAMAFLDGIAANGFTNYDAALNTAQTAFGTAGKIAGAQNIGYFLSDGVPNRPTGSEGISAAEEAAWETFLTNNDIKSYAIGIGTGVTTGPLEPIAYDGVAGTELAAVQVDDLADLPAVLVNTVPPSTVTGSILSDPGPIGQFGADNGRVHSITINGATYTYNPATDSISVTGGPNNGTFNATTNVLTVTTTLGGRMALDFDDGTYVYTLPPSIPSDVSEMFQYRLVDNDGDISNTENITFNLIDVNRVPLVRNDTIITNIAGSGATIPAPAWALLANDSDPDNDPLTVTAVSGATEGSVALASGVATFTDNDSDGGTYNYTGSDGTLSNNGHVIVNRAQANEATLDGTGFGEILIGRSANDTILANDGNDVLIGGGGNDVLNAGAGDDIMLFQGLSSNYLGGAGADTLRIESIGTLDLRATATDDARIESIDRLALTTPLTVQLDYQGLLDLEADGNSLRITAGSGATTLDLSEALGASGTNVWVKTVDTATVDTYVYTPSGGGAVATLVVDNQINVV